MDALGFLERLKALREYRAPGTPPIFRRYAQGRQIPRRTTDM